MNEKNQLLVIQEKYLLALKRPIWKLPGGLGDPGIYTTERIGHTIIIVIIFMIGFMKIV